MHMAKQRVTFIATKYKNKPTQVNFYAKNGQRVSFDAVEKVRTKQGVEFYTDVSRRTKSRRKRVAA